MSVYEALNPEQKAAVERTEGPVLILAGAGSGKTRVLTQRVAYLIGEKNVAPWNILAITFTNKAAKEMKERVEKAVGEGAQGVFVATFHATCVRILRRHAELLGYDNHFSIYDSDDSKTVMKRVLKQFQLETRDLKLRRFLNAVSSAKDALIPAEAYLVERQYDRDVERISRAYLEYQKALFEANAFDFDDLIMKTVELFRKFPDVLSEYQERFRYICVDEYQDTNHAQFELIHQLADRYRNLCVVGDDDQSIYRFRGANIRNILDFEHVYPDAFVVKLEQNYRSTQTILNAANGVIAHNTGRKEKALWSDLGEGAPVRFFQFDSAYDEADFIADDVARMKRAGKCDYADVAVCYRTNAQSRLLEERFVREGIPYELVGGVNFYARKEIKDILAYLKTIENGRDDLAVTRIVNIPKRGIGNTTIEKFSDYAAAHGISFFEALTHADEIASGAAKTKVDGFVKLIYALRTLANETGVEALIRETVERVGYEEYLNGLLDEALLDDEENERMRNVGELISKAADYEESVDDPSLTGFLEEVALVADIDLTDATQDRTMLMTLHSAKGLEFSHVYITGMEEDIFPSYQARQAEDFDATAMEEERRLAYVGYTRAKRKLTLSAARARMLHGETRYNAVSRFVLEIPKDAIETESPLEDATQKTQPQERPFRARHANALYTSPPKTAFSSLQKGVPKAGEKPDYDVGDRVLHVKFGLGEVTSLEKETRDYKVGVRFDDYGPKVMYAAFAKLVKV